MSLRVVLFKKKKGKREPYLFQDTEEQQSNLVCKHGQDAMVLLLLLAICLQVGYSKPCLLTKRFCSELELIILLLFQIPRDVKHKLVYFAKKMTENMGESDFSQTILFGEIPRSLLTHVTAFLDEVLVCL